MANQGTPVPSSSKENAVIAGWRDRPLVLIGLMGSGKSTVGRRLANAIGWRFVDSDEEIESAAGCSISDIFAIYGEPMFRDLEERVIGRLLSEGPMVLATGGGAWMQPRIRTMIKERATSLWLRAEIEVLVERVSRRDHRPLLKNGDKQGIMKRLMEERYPVYAEADLTIDSSKGPHEQVVEYIVTTLRNESR